MQRSVSLRASVSGMSCRPGKALVASRASARLEGRRIARLQSNSDGRGTGLATDETSPSNATRSYADNDGATSSASSMSSVDVTTSETAPAKRRVRKAESTDAVATFLTRRFGIAGGLAWLGFLAVGTLGEQVKTRLEVAQEEGGAREVADSPELVLPNGLRYRDLRIGGGQSPPKGYLAVVNYIGRANGEEFENTYARGKPIVLRFGGRPLTGGLCEGAELALSTMKAGGKRIVVVPPELGFGEAGASVRPTLHAPDKQGLIPGGATLEYELELVRVSIPPS